MGGWTFVDPYLEWVLAHDRLKAKRPRYVGRPASASTATGLMSGTSPNSSLPRRSLRLNSGETGPAKAVRNSRPSKDRRTRPTWPKSAFPPSANPSPKRRSASWFKKAGDAVAADEPLVELETDKVTPGGACAAAGVLARSRQGRRDRRPGAVLGRDDRRWPAPPAKPQGPARCRGGPKADRQAAGRRARQDPAMPARSAAAPRPPMPILAPSAASCIAESNLDDQRRLGAGKDGRVTKGDMLAALGRPRRRAGRPPPSPRAPR
jgi:hypothetical protein